MVCDGIVIINRGRVVAQGTQAQLVEQVFPTARIEIEIGGPREAVEAALRGIPGVLRVQDLTGADGSGRFLVESPRGRDVRGEVVQLVATRGWKLLELHQVGMSLEEVFIRVVAGEEHGEVAATEAPAAPAAGATA